MAGENDPTSPDDFEARLRKARKALEARDETEGRDRSNALSVAFRLGIELIASVAVGIGIGWLLDRWLGTSPVFFLIFFVFGAASGIRTVMRTARRMNINQQSESNDDVS
ncbi:MAG: AtpZ/AtpI family protein [Sphingomonadales bacterium]